jgi:hypothetical protein
MHPYSPVCIHTKFSTKFSTYEPVGAAYGAQYAGAGAVYCPFAYKLRVFFATHYDQKYDGSKFPIAVFSTYVDRVLKRKHLTYDRTAVGIEL